MQPLAAEIHRKPVLAVGGPGAAASALARLQHKKRDAAGIGEPPPGGDAGGTGADHCDIDFGRKLSHPHSRAAADLRFAPSPPLGAERVGVRWGIPERSPIPTSPSQPCELGPSLSPLKGGEGF